MLVNDMIKRYGYIRNRLNHFTFSIFNPQREDWIVIKHPTADEYIYLCDREIIDWMPSEDDEKEIDITIYMIPEDYDTFRTYMK